MPVYGLSVMVYGNEIKYVFIIEAKSITSAEVLRIMGWRLYIIF